MYGPVFKVGDKVVWEDEQDARTCVRRFEQGPFTVESIEDNDDPKSCGCGASRQNNYRHALTVNFGSWDFYQSDYDNCDELPAQWVTVRQAGGELLLDEKGVPHTFCSGWFKLLS